MGVIGWIVVGLIAGALARLLVPGKDDMGILGTLLLGLAGSLVGGFLAQVLFDDTAIGIVGSTIGAIVVLLIYRSMQGRTRAV